MGSRIFIDSNLWIYALTESRRECDLEKRHRTLSLLARSKTIVVSVQVINEVHWNFVKKFRFSDELAYHLIEKGIKPLSRIVPVAEETYKRAYDLRGRYQLSFWDSLIVASALLEERIELYTEDMQHELEIEGKMKILNPFLTC